MQTSGHISITSLNQVLFQTHLEFCRRSICSLAPAPSVPASCLSGERSCLTADGRTALKRQLKQLLTSCANILSLTLWYSSSLSSIDLLRLSSLNGCILFCWTEKRNQEGYPSWAVRNLQFKQLSAENNKCSLKQMEPEESYSLGSPRKPWQGVWVACVRATQWQEMFAAPGRSLVGFK